MTKYSLRIATMNESELRKVYVFPIFPRDSNLILDKGFVNIDYGQMGGTHWTCFYIKDNKSYYFDSFGGTPDKLLLNQLPKTIIYHNLKIQDFNSRLSDSYC